MVWRSLSNQRSFTTQEVIIVLLKGEGNTDFEVLLCYLE